MAEPQNGLDLGNIQGNILGGFKQDYQAFLFFQIPDAGQGRAWLAETAGNVASCKKVLAANEAFKRAAKRNADPASVTRAILVNVAFTHKGLAALGISQADLNAFPAEFKDGMRARACLLGDVDESAPEKWIEPLRNPDIHGILIVAADRSQDRDRKVSRQKQLLAKYGLKLRYIQTGMVRRDDPGHEHFGFKDGVSQPGIRGVTPPNNPKDPNQGDPGQDLIEPGEFVLGHPTEQSPAEVPSTAWAKDGSYLVFRRLRQDVEAFRNFVHRQAKVEGFSDDLMGAKLVGRYKSGAPLERTKDESPGFDPTKADPSKAFPKILDPAHVNNFEYGDDPEGRFVPRAAHIRKAYPREENPPGEHDSRTHRLLRRGIPFGESFQERAPPGSPRAGDAKYPHDRGLLFVCYQSSIANQFEHVQRQMVNNPDFPRPGDGQDPLISQAAAKRHFLLPGGRPDHLTLMQRWVTTTGGDYFFSPSVSALHELSAEHHQERRTAMAEYPDMPNFYKFVASVWTSDHAGGKSTRKLIVDADKAVDEMVHMVTTVAQRAARFLATNAGVPADEAPSDSHTADAMANASEAAAMAIAEAQAEVLKRAGSQNADIVKGAAVTSRHAVFVTNCLRSRGATDKAELMDATHHDLAIAIVKASNAWTLALTQAGVNVPPNRVIYVHRNTATEYHYVIPEPPATDPWTLEHQAEEAIPHAMTCN